MTKNKQTIPALVQQIIAKPYGRNPAVHALAARGAPAVKAVLEAMRKPAPRVWKHHPRDVTDALMGVLHQVAWRNPKILVDAIEKEKSHTFEIVWALQSAPPEHSINALLQAIRHPDQYVRWAAVEGLVKCRSRRAIGPLVEALKDRSSFVKGVVVQTMKKSKFFRVPEAIGPLQKIVNSQAIERHSPGTWLAARDILAMIQKK